MSHAHNYTCVHLTTQAFLWQTSVVLARDNSNRSKSSESLSRDGISHPVYFRQIGTAEAVTADIVKCRRRLVTGRTGCLFDGTRFQATAFFLRACCDEILISELIFFFFLAADIRSHWRFLGSTLRQRNGVVQFPSEFEPVTSTARSSSTSRKIITAEHDRNRSTFHKDGSYALAPSGLLRD